MILYYTILILNRKVATFNNSITERLIANFVLLKDYERIKIHYLGPYIAMHSYNNWVKVIVSLHIIWHVELLDYHLKIK